MNPIERMPMKAFLLLMILASLGAAQVPGADPLQLRPGGGAPIRYQYAAGKWKAWVERTLADDPRMQAPRHRVVVYRRGPDDMQSAVLYRQITNRPVKVWLREDGTAIIEGGGVPRPLLSFPYRKLMEIPLPGPSKWSHPFKPHTSIGDMWFLGDVVVYSRNAGPGHTLIGFFRIDSARHQVVDSHLSLEVVEEREEPARGAKIDFDGPLFRAGDFVFWTNQGGNIPAAEPWRQRKVRALNLKSNTITEATEVPIETLRPHKAELLDFLQQKVHDREKELEAWALSVIEQIGGKDDLKALATMESRAHSSKSLYTKAISSISSR